MHTIYLKRGGITAETNDGDLIENGWGIFKQTTDTTDELHELLAVVDTETMADALIAAIDPPREHKRAKHVKSLSSCRCR